MPDRPVDLVDSGFVDFLESAPDAVVVIDSSGKIVLVNALAEQMFGYKRDEMLGQQVEILIPDKLRTRHVGHREGYFRDPRTRPMGAGQALEGKRKDGTEFQVEISLSPLQSGNTILVTSIIRDISARVEAEAKFRGLLESAPDGIVVVDSAGKIAIVNTQTERMFGYDREELIGQPIEILVPDRYRRSHVAQRDSYIAAPRTRPMGAGQALAGKRKNGTEFPVEISLSPLQSGDTTLVTSIIRDLSARIEAEAKFRGLLESAPDGIVVVDPTAKIVIVNTQAERMFGYKREELIGQPIEILVPDQYRKSHIAQRDAYIASPRTRPMGAGRALMGKKKDGTEFPVEISLSPLKGESESGTLITSIIRDITEHREAEERIKASLREKEVMLKEIHHRVKNNLQVTSSLLKLQSGYIHDAASREMFNESQNRIRSMALVHEKLYQSSDLSRINMSEYVESLAMLLMRSFGTSTNQIHFDVARTDVFLSIETAVPCGLILNELISNSLKHAFTDRAHGTIRVGIRRDSPGEVAMRVADDGKGFPRGIDLEHVETLGFRLVHTLTEQLDGRIEIRGDQGTEVIIVFPEPEKVSK